jgi:hypothetical protein
MSIRTPGKLVTSWPAATSEGRTVTAAAGPYVRLDLPILGEGQEWTFTISICCWAECECKGDFVRINTLVNASNPHGGPTNIWLIDLLNPGSDAVAQLIHWSQESGRTSEFFKIKTRAENDAEEIEAMSGRTYGFYDPWMPQLYQKFGEALRIKRKKRPVEEEEEDSDDVSGCESSQDVHLPRIRPVTSSTTPKRTKRRMPISRMFGQHPTKTTTTMRDGEIVSNDFAPDSPVWDTIA